ncbi:uncharacterized protein LOC119562577 isoform X2 [Drosophila subpulchrella]|uniref:uncharacterized protein LOC119562577 isoform X2 n=1 Tax=Drosophila subpulchrella TaxID=1486046 RepID=UPI0018A1B34E|nr:uncharacterized protein LOC119562577 isoform X2 [Drosophila subpulchrella]
MEERPRKRLQEEAIPQQGESAEYFKCWRRSSRESQWEGTFRVGLRSLHGHPAGRVLGKKLSTAWQLVRSWRSRWILWRGG